LVRSSARACRNHRSGARSAVLLDRRLLALGRRVVRLGPGSMDRRGTGTPLATRPLASQPQRLVLPRRPLAVNTTEPGAYLRAPIAVVCFTCREYHATYRASRPFKKLGADSP